MPFPLADVSGNLIRIEADPSKPEANNRQGVDRVLFGPRVYPTGRNPEDLTQIPDGQKPGRPDDSAFIGRGGAWDGEGSHLALDPCVGFTDAGMMGPYRNWVKFPKS